MQSSGLVANDWAGHTLMVTYPVATLLWQHATRTFQRIAPAAQPSTVPGAALAMDLSRQQAVLLVPHIGPAPQTWIWDMTASAWQLQNTPTAPNLLFAALGYDVGRNRIVSFGGSAPAGLTTNETWEWDGAAWNLCQPANAPSLRGSAAMAYDLTAGRMVLFGGADNLSDKNDVWDWDGNDWTQRPVNSGPSPRAGMALCSRGDGVLVVGGYDRLRGSALDEVWLLQGNQWTQLPSDPLPPTSTAPAVFDLSSNELVVFGGQTPAAIMGGVWILGVPPAAALSLGGGCAGSGGAAILAARGLPIVGNGAFALDAAGFLPQQPAAFLLGFDTAFLSLPGACRVFVSPAWLAFATTAAGMASLPLPVPPAMTLAGLHVYAQAAALDPAVPSGLAVTPALDLRIGR
jgi:hypothetical protein